ncbi:MAG: NADH-ubiquinone oxidoreductase-F iron-sulfur binding region domain-containing protein [Solirubrobacteraceae bacterium]
MSLPRVLFGLEGDAMSFDQHHRVHGDLPGAVDRYPALIGEITRAVLRGRGGGGFPLGRKLETVLRGGGDPVVVVNACEGEPMSVKDQMLLRSLPHLVLDGALCCARAVRSRKIVVAVDQTSVLGADAIDQAIEDRDDIGSGGIGIEIVDIPPGYVSGQETSIVSFLNGGPATPTYPPRIFERGVDRHPTLVANPETLANAALIARRGAKWFRQVGTPEEPGSVLVTLAGAVRQPGVYEIEYGSAMRTLLTAAGNSSEPVRAFLIGGYAGTWVDAPSGEQVRLSRAGLKRIGGSMGAGVIVAFPESACPVAEVTRVMDWMADQSAGQCGPCVHGLGSIAQTLDEVAVGAGVRDAAFNVRRWASQLPGRGACAHPDGAARFVSSAMSVFAEEFDDHARHGPCDACAGRPVLATPGLVGAGR